MKRVSTGVNKMKNWQVLFGLDDVKYFETSEQAVAFAMTLETSYSIAPVWQGGNTI